MYTISTELRGYLDLLKGPQFEQTIPYMYVDTVGKITVGVGHNITAHGDLGSLKFDVKRLTRKAVKGGDTGIPIGQPKNIGRSATAAEKKADYDFLFKHKGLGSYGPTQLAAYTTLEMKAGDITALFEKDLQEHIAIVLGVFGTAFAVYPVTCKAALIDIAFNCGSFATFPTLVSVVKGQGAYAGKSAPERWKAAVTYSTRGKVSAARNKQIADWFKAGAAYRPSV